jgi:hypothetical protein
LIVATVLVLARAWFVFAAPSVIPRWTQASGVPVVAAVGLLSLG